MSIGGDLLCFSCVGNDHRWFFFRFAVLLVGGVVIFFFGCVSVGFCVNLCGTGVVSWSPYKNVGTCSKVSHSEFGF